MKHLLSERIKSTPPSSIRGILKVATDPQAILFVGGLPNPVSFPQKELLVSVERIVRDYGSSPLQYSITVRPLELHQHTTGRYSYRFGLKLGIESTLTTIGSQWVLDLISKVLLNIGDGVIVEKPSHLGAIQAFSQYQPVFYPARLAEEGMDVKQLQDVLKYNVKFVYATPDFQNPTGLSYHAENRACIHEVLRRREIILVKDDPCGELCSDEDNRIPYTGVGQLPDSILLGTFPKTATPGMRIGFMTCADAKLLRHISVAKEASDLHTNISFQYLIWDCLMYNDYDVHIDQIGQLHKEQAQATAEAMDQYFPETVRYTRPRGDMSLWVTLSREASALSLFPKALEKKVAFVPGDPLYISTTDTNIVCLNLTNANCSMIDEGIRRLGGLLREI